MEKTSKRKLFKCQMNTVEQLYNFEEENNEKMILIINKVGSGKTLSVL